MRQDVHEYVQGNNSCWRTRSRRQTSIEKLNLKAVNMSIQTPSDEEKDKKPWMYIGYEGLAKWMSSSDDFLVIRRFDSLAARVVLLLQWELVQVEQLLVELDKSLCSDPKEDNHNGSFQLDLDDRTLLIQTAGEKLKVYRK